MDVKTHWEAHCVAAAPLLLCMQLTNWPQCWISMTAAPLHTATQLRRRGGGWNSPSDARLQKRLLTALHFSCASTFQKWEDGWLISQLAQSLPSPCLLGNPVLMLHDVLVVKYKPLQSLTLTQSVLIKARCEGVASGAAGEHPSQLIELIVHRSESRSRLQPV